MLFVKNLTPFIYKRFYSARATSFTLENLSKRTLIRVSGAEVSNFLQGLITNDISHLNSGPGSMYTMFLNTAGRVLFDTILYRNLEQETYFIECDKVASEQLQKHLKMYRVRRKIDIHSLEDEFGIQVLFKSSNIGNLESSVDGLGSLQLNTLSPQNSAHCHKNLLIYPDPRIAKLGYRIIAKLDTNVAQEIGDLTSVNQNFKQNYRWLRYSLGVGEGNEDLPVADCFPLECNCDYLHGVSFHKGCYIGQELTARIHHTGVVRKRIMPIYFSKIPSEKPEEKIIQNGVNLGKFRGIEDNIGLGLLRIDKALNCKEINFGDGIGVTEKPNWWPSEVSKEKINVPKAQ